ncbi:pirin family protein [Kallipyga massiliensis]|uniref:pirin family protein n=1 Tax=Kallipyga massiliensis TaxID=1472764 RepID=UPI0026EEF523|nr:pirin family protein [Kallipyga massiliensis]
MTRKITNIYPPQAGIDGAGVHLYHVLGRHSMHQTDPLLLLDAFDSRDPEKYMAGFPMHPHRGIETISYVYQGAMVHRDSLGNEDRVDDRGVQWMTAGSGIFHEEKLPAVDRLFGVQLWLNLAQKDKFTPPAYRAIRAKDIEEIPFDGGYLRLLAGHYQGHQGYLSHHLPVDYYDVHLDPGKSLTLDLDPDRSVTLFALIGEGQVDDKTLPHFHAAATSEGDSLTLTNPGDEEAAILVFSSVRLDEPIAWWPGPIVMNTEEELEEAYAQVKAGTLVRDRIDMEI